MPFGVDVIDTFADRNPGVPRIPVVCQLSYTATMKAPIPTEAEDLSWKPESLWHAIALEIVIMGVFALIALGWMLFTA